MPVADEEKRLQSYDFMDSDPTIFGCFVSAETPVTL